MEKRRRRIRRASPALAMLVLAAPAAPSPRDAAGVSVAERLGHPKDARLIVLHADDVGMARSVNKASFEALEERVIDSASILVPCPWFPEVASYARAHPEADLGLHLALNSEWTTYRWGPVSPRDQASSLVDEHGYLPLLVPPVAARARPDEVERELRAQIERALLFGIRPTHLDSHMGALFSTPELYRIYRKLGRELGLPVLQDGEVARHPELATPADEVLVDRVVSLEPGVPLPEWRAAYENLLRPLPPGVYELIVHVAHDDEEMRGATADHPDWGAAWRQADFDMLRSSEFKRFLDQEGFIRVTWRELARALPEDYRQRR
jgi:predicted glycoside hydrolase/deacetylase ChbG (UPF0249 family)